MRQGKKQNNEKEAKSVNFMETIRRSKMSRKALFIMLFTGFLLLYGVYAVFAVMVNPGNPESVTTDGTAIAAPDTSYGSDASASSAPSGGGCCGGSQTEVKGAAVVKGDVQEMTIRVNGGYDPNVIEVKKGIPLKLTFEKHSSGGCDAQISIPAINVLEDLPTDGTVTYEIPVPNEAGQVIDFTCGMNMISGQIRVID